MPKSQRYQADLSLESPIDRTDLMEEVIKTGKSVAKELVMEFSEIARPEFEEACKSAGVSYRKLDSRLAPLRIPSISPYRPEELRFKPGSAEYKQQLMRYPKLMAYTDFLVEQRGLMPLEKENFKYWHEISVYSLVYDH